MKALEDYIAFDLEFNQYEGTLTVIIQVLRRSHDGVDHYDSYVAPSISL